MSRNRIRPGSWTSDSVRVRVLAAGRAWATGQRRLVKAVTALDASGEWALDGASTCAHWVADALGVEMSTAREWLRVGRSLTDLEVVDRAFGEGRLSYSKVRALTRIATPSNQEELCDVAERVPAGRLPTALAAWLSRRETPEQTERRHHDARGMSWRVDPYGMVVGAFRLPPVDAATLTGAIDALVASSTRTPSPPPEGSTQGGEDASADAIGSRSVTRWPSIAQQRADALVELVRSGGAQVVTEVVLHVRADGCTLDDGTPIPASVVEKAAPAAFIRALIHDAAARPINASGRRRHPSARQRRVVRERDGACIDCGSTEHLEFDHDPEFEITGRTLVEELHLRCRACHRRRHRWIEGAA